MTRYILENLESRGTYYVSDERPLTIDQRHTVRITKDRDVAAGFDSMTQAALTAGRIPGRWEPKAI